MWLAIHKIGVLSLHILWCLWRGLWSSSFAYSHKEDLLLRATNRVELVLNQSRLKFSRISPRLALPNLEFDNVSPTLAPSLVWAYGSSLDQTHFREDWKNISAFVPRGSCTRHHQEVKSLIIVPSFLLL